MQSETADFAPGAATSACELDETYASSLILAHSFYYVKA